MTPRMNVEQLRKSGISPKIRTSEQIAEAADKIIDRYIDGDADLQVLMLVALIMADFMVELGFERAEDMYEL